MAGYSKIEIVFFSLEILEIFIFLAGQRKADRVMTKTGYLGARESR